MVDLSLVKPENLWYTIGFIATDGNLSIDGRHICLTSKDKDILEGLKTALNLNISIGIKSRAKQRVKEYFTLQIGDVRFYRYLLSLGLTPRKSLTLKPLNVPQEYFIDFVRGVVDGDGNISTWQHKTNGYIQWSLRIFSAAPEFTSWLKKQIESQFQVQGKVYRIEKPNANPVYTIKFGKLAAKVILQKCYYKNCLSLNRKFLKAVRCLKTRNGLSKYGKVINF